MSAQSTKSRLLLKVVLVLIVIVGAIAIARYVLRPTARVVAVASGLATDGRPGSVTVAAHYELLLKTEIAGRVIKSVLDEGKAFKQGDFMAQFDTGDLDITIEKAENDYATLKNRIAIGSQVQLQLESAQADLANQERLLLDGQAAEADVKKQRNAVKAIEQQLALEKVNNDSQLKADLVGLKEDRRQRDKMTMTAPFDGVISEVDARPGALINSGDIIAHFITAALTVQARISEENFGNITVGDQATVIFLSSGGSKSFKATVSKILPSIEAATQRYVVYLDVQIPLQQLKPGMTGEVSIIVDKHNDVLQVPRRALGGNKVLVVKDGRVELRTVKVGIIGLNRVEILDGVKEGDLVISDDVDQFNAGEAVRTEVLPMP